MSRKRKKEFKYFLRRYSLVLTVLMIIIIIYVIASLNDYESLQVNNYLSSTMNKVIAAGEKDQLSKYVDTSKIVLSEYENKDVSVDKAISKMLKNSKIEYKLNNESFDLNNPVYDAYVNGNNLLKIELNGEKKKVKLGILSVQDWQLRKIELTKPESLYNCEIIVPNDCTVYINNIKVDSSVQDEEYINEELKELAKYVELPYMTKYDISNLLKEPDIRIEDKNNEKVDYEKEGNKFTVNSHIEKIQDESEALKKLKSNIDVLKIAKDWSLYLSNDLKGELHGFNTISKYLIKNSYMWEYAHKWATNVDITFISTHSLDNPTFTNTKLSNFEIYSDKAFSTDVYLEKNMILTKRNNQKIQDVLHERMYFVYYNGVWKLVNMQSISKK